MSIYSPRQLRAWERSGSRWGEALMEKSLTLVLILIVASLGAPRCITAQTTPGPDLLVLTSGERLTGHLQEARNGKVNFVSDALGKISVEWGKVQELHPTQRFAVIRKDVNLTSNFDVNTIPQGTIAVAGQMITITPGSGRPPQTIAVTDVSDVVEQQVFLNAVQRPPGILQAWTGTATLGAALVESTQNSVSLATSVSLVRSVPAQDWLPPRNRTTADFSSSYGRLSQPATPVVKTSIFHADAERDEYFKDNVFALANVAFDHSFSQGLDLQQIYGLGVGWTAVKNATQNLNLQGSLSYARQSFLVANQDRNLIGSVFLEDFTQKLLGSATISQKLAINPAWNLTRAYSGNASVVFAIPLYKEFSFSTSVVDAFLNDPPPGFKKNSFQFTTALGYTFGSK